MSEDLSLISEVKDCIRCGKPTRLAKGYDGEWLCNHCFCDKWSGLGLF